MRQLLCGSPCGTPGLEYRRTSSNCRGDAFLERMLGGKVLDREVAVEFAKELSALVNELKESAALGAIEPVWKCAHKIKGSAANVGGDTLRDVASEIEQAGEAGELERIGRLTPDLEKQAAGLIEALQKWSD